MNTNHFSYNVVNEFIDSKETEICINYCGRQIGVAFLYLDEVYLEFTDNQPMIKMTEWHYLETILKQIKKRFCPVS